MAGTTRLVLDFLHVRKVSLMNLRFKSAQFPRYPNFATLNTYGNPPNSQKRFSPLSIQPLKKATQGGFFKWRERRGCLDLFALNVSTDFLFRNFVSSKEKSSALCLQVARTRAGLKQPAASSHLFIPQLLTKK